MNSKFCYFIILKTLLHYLLACIISNEKHAIIFIFVPLCVMSFSMAIFKVFSITSFEQFDYNVFGVVFFMSLVIRVH